VTSGLFTFVALDGKSFIPRSNSGRIEEKNIWVEFKFSSVGPRRQDFFTARRDIDAPKVPCIFCEE